MSALRLLLPRHARAVWLLLTLAGAMRLLAPAGFMPNFAEGGVGLVACDGMAAEVASAMPAMARDHVMSAMPGMAQGDQRQPPAKSDTVCPFAALSLPGLAGGDAAAIAPPAVPVGAPAILPRPAAPPSGIVVHLRPPSQGPPRIA